MANAGTNGNNTTRSYEDIDDFILAHRVEKGCEFTHTSLAKPVGSFYVPVDELDTFFKLYSSAVDAGQDLHITEKNRHIGPLTIDLDFRFDNSVGLVRQYNEEHVRNIAQLYIDAIAKYLHMDSSVDLYVMEKATPVTAPNGTCIKDGLHIVIPHVVTRASIKFLIRDYVLEKIQPILDAIHVTNKADDVVDEAVIQKNNWFMYGSKKPQGNTYKVTYIYQYDYESNELSRVMNTYATDDLVRLLSIRNKYEETGINVEHSSDIMSYEQKLDQQRKNQESSRTILTNDINPRANCFENLEQIKKLVDILKPERCDSYHDWIRLGWCLRNIDHRLLEKWVEFSKKSPKYVDGECQKYWNRMKESGLGVGTLHMWAKTDSPDAYKLVVRSELKNLMYQSTTGTHHDIAKVVQHMFKYEFVCASIKSRCWYEFRSHRWQVSDSGYGLRMRISDDVWREYHQAAIEYHTAAMHADGPTDQSRFQELAKKMNEIAIKLRTTSFKENLMKECSELFYIEKFEERLDSNVHLIGFNNGVYDLEAMEFREGRPEDYISFTTGNDFVEYDPTHPYITAINTYLAQVLTKPQVREYVMKLFASFLTGQIKEQKFHIWTGSGSNSKSKLVELFEKGFGDYCCKFPITLLTQKRAASNAATTELARAKGKRFGCLQEPSEDERINIGLMKELSGGDKILARAIYKEPVEFKPQFKMLLLCNQLPHVPSDDGGTWRRIRVVEFTSKFVEYPSAENEFPIDLELSDKLEAWKSHFMALLLQYYKRYVDEGIQEPQEVLKCTSDYKSQNDYYNRFLQEYVEQKDSAFLALDEIYTELRNWIRDDGVPLKAPSKPDMERYLSKNLTKCVVVSGMKGFKGFKMRSVYQANDEIDEDF
jgi:P4 family phage/plasmid primase-like protien